MKKLQQAWRREYKPLKLFKDDLEAIVNIAKEYEAIDAKEWEKKVSITAEDYQLDNISELKEINKEIISDFYMSVGTSSLTLRLNKNSASLYVHDDKNTVLMGIANKIDDILQNRQRRFNFFFTYGGHMMLFALPIMLLGVSLTCLFLVLKLYYLIPIVAIAGGYTGAKTESIPAQYSTIIMSHLSETPNFFKRNKDKILVGIVVGIIVCFFSVLGTLLVQWITKKY